MKTQPKRGRRLLAAALALLLVSGWPAPARSWWDSGHRLVALVAFAIATAVGTHIRSVCRPLNRIPDWAIWLAALAVALIVRAIYLGGQTA